MYNAAMLSSLMVASYLTEKNGSSSEIEGYRSIDASWLPLFEMSYEENDGYEARFKSTFRKNSNGAGVCITPESRNDSELLPPFDSPHFSQFSCNAQLHELRRVKEINGEIKYYFIDDEPNTSQIKLVCQPCIKSVTSTLDAGEAVGEQKLSSGEDKIRPWVEKVPTVSEREWKFLNSNEIFEDHCALCNVKLLNIFHSRTGNSQIAFHNSKFNKPNGDVKCSKASSDLGKPAKLLQFSQHRHSVQFFRLIKEVKHQMNYFSVESHPQNKRFSVHCTLCNKSMERVTTAARHVRQKEHLLHFAKNCANIVMVPLITEDYWKFLMPLSDSEDFMCYLCHVQLSNSPVSWMEHFQSESHIVLKSQQLQNDDSDSDISARGPSVESLKNRENSVGTNTNKNELQRLESSSISCAKSTSASSTQNDENGSDIWESKESLEITTLPKYYTNTFNFKFTRFCHIQQFLRIIKKINDQINCFSFESLPASKRLKLTCLFCREFGALTGREGSVVIAAANHVKEKEHLLNLLQKRPSVASACFVPTLSEQSWNCITPEHRTKSFTCTLCNMKLHKSSVKGSSILASACIKSWVDHLQNESHLLKLQKLYNPDFDKENSCCNFFNNVENSAQNSAQIEVWLAKQKHFEEGRSLSGVCLDSFPNPETKKQSKSFVSSDNENKDLSSVLSVTGESEVTDEESILESLSSERSKTDAVCADKSHNCVSKPSSVCGESRSSLSFYNNAHGVFEREHFPKTQSIMNTDQDVFNLETQRISQATPREYSLHKSNPETHVTSAKGTLIQEASKHLGTPNDKMIDDDMNENMKKEILETPSLPDLFQDLFDLEFEHDSTQEQVNDESIPEVPLPENLFQDTFDSDSFSFVLKSQKEQLENLTKELKYQINYFSIDPQTKSQKMTLICKLCNKSVHVSKAEEHANDQEHLENLFAKAASARPLDSSNLSGENWQFLDFIPSSQEYLCTLCNMKLSNNSDSWGAHFHSDSHIFKLAESQTVNNLAESNSELSNKSRNVIVKDQVCKKHAEESIHSHTISKSEALDNDLKDRRSNMSVSVLNDYLYSKSVDKAGQSVKRYAAEKNTHSDGINKSEVPIKNRKEWKINWSRSDMNDQSCSKSADEPSKFKSSGSELTLNERLYCKAVDESGKSPKSYAQAAFNTNSPKRITNLDSVFKFVKIDSFFLTFPLLSRSDQVCLRRNCKFILIDADSKEVFCTACHYFFFVKSEDEKVSLKNLTFHFTSLHHKTEAHRYGPAAYFQKNISSITFFENDTGFCSVCKISLLSCIPQDIDFLLGHFESKEHANLIRVACNYNDRTHCTKVNNDLVTLFLGKKKYDSRVFISKTSS